MRRRLAAPPDAALGAPMRKLPRVGAKPVAPHGQPVLRGRRSRLTKVRGAPMGSGGAQDMPVPMEVDPPSILDISVTTDVQMEGDDSPVLDISVGTDVPMKDVNIIDISVTTDVPME